MTDEAAAVGVLARARAEDAGALRLVVADARGGPGADDGATESDAVGADGPANAGGAAARAGDEAPTVAGAHHTGSRRPQGP